MSVFHSVLNRSQLFHPVSECTVKTCIVDTNFALTENFIFIITAIKLSFLFSRRKLKRAKEDLSMDSAELNLNLISSIVKMNSNRGLNNRLLTDKYSFLPILQYLIPPAPPSLLFCYRAPTVRENEILNLN